VNHGINYGARCSPRYWQSIQLTDTEHLLAICEKEMIDALENRQCADLLDRAGHYSEARPLFERALAIRENVRGREHPDTATSLYHLAYLLQAQRDLAGAQPLSERALAIREKVFGPEHPDTVQGLDYLALLRQAQGDLAGARPLFERALAIWPPIQTARPRSTFAREASEPDDARDEETDRVC
jgi:tetratricopeptide (TPR) repeat protein